MRSSHVLSCVLLAWGCVDTELPPPAAVPDAAVATLGASRGVNKPPLASATAAAGAAAGSAARSQRASPSAAGTSSPDAELESAADGGAAPPRMAADGAARALVDAGPLIAAPSRAGDLLITELMIDPKTLTDNQGEWLELYNASGMELELRGCELDDGDKTPHAISGAVRMASAGYLSVARHAAPGFMPSLVMPLSLTNSQDSVAVRCGGVEIDRVHYDARAGSPLHAGASLALDPGAMTAAQNDGLGAWCAALDSYGPELGTPGRPNPPCHTPDPDAGAEPLDPEGPAPEGPEPEPEEPAPAE